MESSNLVIEKKSPRTRESGQEKGEEKECVFFDVNSCFKKKKRGGLFCGRGEHLRFPQVGYAVGVVFCTCFFFPP